jgi:hypothetical protein
MRRKSDKGCRAKAAAKWREAHAAFCQTRDATAAVELIRASLDAVDCGVLHWGDFCVFAGEALTFC